MRNGMWAPARPGVVAVVVLVVGGLVALIGLDVVRAEDHPVARERAATREISKLKSNGWRVELVAERGNGGRATVRVAAFRRVSGDWDRVGRALRVGRRGEWLWKVVTRRFGVHMLGARIPGGLFPLQVRVRILRSPSVGSSAPFFFAVHNGRLDSIDV